MLEIVESKLGFVVKGSDMEEFLTAAIAGTEQVKREEFERTIRVYMGIFYLTKLDLKGIGWLAR